MDEVNNDNEGFELNDAETVAVVPAPTNGTGRQAPNVIGRTIVEKFAPDSHVPSMTVNPLMGRVNNRAPYAPEKSREKDDREYLDSFNMTSKAGEYRLKCTRYQPSTNADGDQVPTGMNSLHEVSCMSYDELQQEICMAWGGGAYRVTFIEENGKRADDIQRCILINIPTAQHPPKITKFEKIEPTRSLKIPIGIPLDESTEDAKRRERDYQEQVKEERRQEALDMLEAKKNKRELEKIRREKELAQIRKEVMAPVEDRSKNAEIELLKQRLEEEKKTREEAARRQEEDRKEERRRYEEDKKESQRRADDDRKMMFESLAKLGDSIKEIVNRPVVAPAPDNTLKELGAMMVPVLTAMITRPAPLPPDHTPLIMEMNKINAESQRSNMQIVTAIMQKPTDDGSAKMIDNWMKISSKDNSKYDGMIEKLLSVLISKDKGQVMTPDMIFNLQDKMEQRLERLMNISQGNAPQDGEGEAGYDPALGFLGNAGKALFGSLKALMDSAASNPALLELVAKVVGSRNPTDLQLAQAAYQMEHSGQIPPAIGYQAQPQLPHDYAPINQPTIPYPPPPQPYQQPQRPRAGPPPLAQPPAQPAATQQSVENELEGATSGLPSNADPEQTQPMSAEELADANLNEAVTFTVEIMIGEATGKPEKRVWPEDASDHWNKTFIKRICDEPSEHMRLQMVGSKCDPAVAQRLNVIWQADPQEQAIFWTEFRRFVDMNKTQRVQTIVTPVAPQTTTTA